MPAADRRAGAAAALVAIGLGLLAGVMMVAGHQPWDGPQIASFSQTHGLHRGDLLAFGPVLVGAGLARWCWQQGRRSGSASLGPSADR